MEEIDTSLIEAHERLLRWCQAPSRTVVDRDAFATYTAATWQAIAVATPDMSVSSRTVIRMHRFVMELLADVKKSTDILPSTGALLLVAALSRSNAWNESSWVTVLQTVADTDKLVAQRFRVGQFAEAQNENDVSSCSEDGATSPVSSAFLDDAVAAAASIFQYFPQMGLMNIVPFLAAADHRIRTASACRLRHSEWIPRNRHSVRGEGAAVLDQFEAAVREGEAGSALPSDDSSSCSDVIYAVLSSVIGAELAKEMWDVEEALACFNEWEARVDEDMETEPTSAHEDSAGSSPSTAAEQLPADCQRRCVAVLSAWELMLLGFHNQRSQQPCPLEQTKGGSGAAVPSAPHDLVSIALQLTPDQVAGSKTAQGWPSLPSPFLEEGPSPLEPLLRLLFHIIACERLAGSRGCQDMLSQVLANFISSQALESETSTTSRAPPDFSVFALATRVLFLVLQAMPAAARAFWEHLPKRRDRELIERLITKVFSVGLAQAESHAACAQLEAQKDKFPNVEASIVRRARQIVLQLARDEVNAEITIQLPDSFPLRMATAEPPEKMPGIPRPRIRNWMLQGRQVLAGPSPMGIGRVMLMWARSFALFFEGVEDCPICYNVVHLTTQTIPRKACPTCKHKFHSECLYHWFKTSAKTTCPLCNQPF